MFIHTGGALIYVIGRIQYWYGTPDTLTDTGTGILSWDPKCTIAIVYLPLCVCVL